MHDNQRSRQLKKHVIATWRRMDPDVVNMPLMWKLICCSVSAKVRWNQKNLSCWARVWDYKTLVEQEQILRLKLWGFKMLNQIKSFTGSILFLSPLIFVEVAEQEYLNDWFRRINNCVNKLPKSLSKFILLSHLAAGTVSSPENANGPTHLFLSLTPKSLSEFVPNSNKGSWQIFFFSSFVLLNYLPVIFNFSTEK